MAVQRPHWSYSALNQYLRCPRQYYFERVLKLPKTSVCGGLILGSVVHSTLAEYHLAVQHRIQLRKERLLKAFLDSWTCRETEKPIEYRNGETRTGLIDQGIALVEEYLSQPPPEGIVSVEEIVVPVRNSDGNYLEKPLVAITDLITRDENGLKVTDFKTSGRAYGQSEVATSLQATCYVNAVWESTREWASVEFTVFVKTKTPKIQRISTARNERDLSRLGDLIEIVQRVIDREVFVPIETPLNCSTCAYREPCQAWKPTDKSCRDDELHQLTGIPAC